MAFWSIVCAVAGLGFAAEGMGLFAHELNLGLAFFLLLLSGCLALPRGTRSNETDRRRAAFGGVAAIVGILFLPSALDLRFFAIAVWFFGLGTFLKARGGQAPFLLSLSLGSLLYGIGAWCSGASLLCWYPLQSASRWVSESVGRLCGEPLSLGPTFSGVGMLGLGLAIAGSGLLLSPWTTRSVARWIAACAFILILHFGYLCLFAILPLGMDAPAGGGEISAWDRPLGRLLSVAYPLHVSGLLPLAVAFVLGWYLRPKELATVTPQRGAAFGPLLATSTTAVLAVWALTNVPVPARGDVRRVALYEEGFLNWMVPTHQKYGRYSSGMFGNMPLLIQSMGWEAERIDEIRSASLAGKDILVVINQDEALPSESIRQIQRFVHRGGALLVLGDHTFWKSEKRLLVNEPLASTHIRLRFDSADFFIGGWLHSYRYWPHPITNGLGDHTNEAGSVVGASLEIAYPATPLVIGRYGYSDPGVPEGSQRGYLGNLDYDPGEMLGDVVLIAAENVGRGRVLVAGDTSSFTNAIQNRTWPFIQRAFFWLGNGGQATVPAWRDALGVALSLMSALLLLLTARRHPWVLPAASAVFFASVWLSHQVVQGFGRPPPLSGNVAFVDLSHVGDFSLEGWHEDGIDGVYLNLMREGYFPLAGKDFDRDQILASDLFLTIAPRRPYSASELRALRRFVENGGTVLLAVGWEERSASAGLLEMAGLRQAARPLGRAEGAGAPIPETPIFYEAWPVLGGDPLVRARGEPVIVRKALGRGQFIVIGDSQFLLNKNLEVKEGAILPNVRLFCSLLNQYVRR